MNNPSPSVSSSSATPASPKVIQTSNKDHEEPVTITEKINLTKDQYEVLNIICNTYEESIAQHM